MPYSNRYIAELGDISPQVGTGLRIKARYPIKIQVTGTSATYTLPASIVPGNSVIKCFGSGSSGANARSDAARLEITDANTITAIRNASGSGTCIVTGLVTEYEAGVILSKQVGTLTIADTASSGTATISSVRLPKSQVFYAGSTSPSAGTFHTVALANITITNSTTLTAARDGTDNALTVGYQVVEFAS